MATRVCKICGKSFRKGRAVFISAERGLKGAIVCEPCANAGATIVAAKPSAALCKCGRAATMCGACGAEHEGKAAARGAKPLVAKLKELHMKLELASEAAKKEPLMADSVGYLAGQVEGVEKAMAIVAKGGTS